MANRSKYTFSEVEKKLDIVKDNQGSDKVLLGDGTYGEKPKDGKDGTDGVGILKIEKTATKDLVDTYTITFTNNTTTTFNVTNGKDGVDGVDGDGAVTDEQITTAVEEYLKENPIDGSVSTEDIADAITKYMEENADNFKGEVGKTPNLTIGTVETLAAGSNATASISGTVEEPVLNLGIPKGKAGANGDGTGADVLDGKKILCIGDSICEGGCANGESYPYWIQQWHKDATVYNLGVGGMTVAQKDSSITNSMPVRIASGEFENEEYADPDIVILEGGINDLMNNVKHGYIQKSYNATKYTTFCQGMEYMFSYFKELFPNARMIFMTIHHVSAYDYNKAQSWWGAASEICGKWGVEFLDLFSLVCTEKIEGLQLHPSSDVYRDYYMPFINRALISETPLSAPITTKYYALNPACTIYFHNGTQSFEKGTTISTDGWRINMIRCDGTTYENVSSSVKYDLSDVDNTTEGTYPVHAFYSENGINLSIDVDITITGENTERTLDSISAIKTTTAYNVGNEISTDDITVTATYTDGSSVDVTASATFDTSNINNTTTGEYNIAVSYTENEITKTTAIQINIVESGATSVIASGTAKDLSTQETITWSLDSDGVMTFDATTSEVTIAMYNDTERPWYNYISQINKAVFKENIVGIGINTLVNAKNLTKVDFQADNVKIGASTFKGCTSLTEIDLTKVNSIGTYGLSNCTSLPSEIVLGATTVQNTAFYSQPQITSIRFTGTPSSIEAEAFTSISGWSNSANLTDIYVPWSEGEVANAPWGAANATVHYDTTT